MPYLGQAAKSQLGPTLPTDVPSGHVFASSVQATTGLRHQPVAGSGIRQRGIPSKQAGRIRHVGFGVGVVKHLKLGNFKPLGAPTLTTEPKTLFPAAALAVTPIPSYASTMASFASSGLITPSH